MEILSYRESRIFSKQATDRILESIAQANGPIILPVHSDSIAYCRRAARDPQVVASITNNPYGLDIISLAIYSFAQGKQIVPMFNSAWKRIGKRHHEAFAAYESMASRSDNLSLARVLFNHNEYSIEGARFKNFYDRFRKISPALIVAEDNYAIIFGKLFRTRVQRLSRHTRSGLKAVRNVWPHVVEAFRDNPVAIRSRRHGRRIRSSRKGK